MFYVLLCVTLCPWFCDHLDGEERAGCFAWFFFLVFRGCCVALVWLFLAMPWVCLQFVIMVFPGHTNYFLSAIMSTEATK